MLDFLQIMALDDKSSEGDLARLAQAVQNAFYEGKADDSEWIIADAMRQNEEVGGSTLTEQELRRELALGDEDEDE